MFHRAQFPGSHVLYSPCITFVSTIRLTTCFCVPLLFALPIGVSDIAEAAQAQRQAEDIDALQQLHRRISQAQKRISYVPGDAGLAQLASQRRASVSAAAEAAIASGRSCACESTCSFVLLLHSTR